MLAHFPFSMENIPRQRGFACFSLKFGTIFSALVIILYTTLALAQCFSELSTLPDLEMEDQAGFALNAYVYVIIISLLITFFLTALMLVGALREKPHLLKPWVVWSSIQVLVSVVTFVYFITVSLINHSNQISLVIFVIEFLWLMVRFYMLMLVASFYKQLEEDRHETQRLNRLVNEKWYTEV